MDTLQPATAVSAYAKVNLRLRILAREANGYHQLETVFCALDLADSLILTPGGEGLRVEVEGAELGPPENNLVYRAAHAFFDASGYLPNLEIRLEKRIPIGGGLGGGSSDAAVTLRTLNDMHQRPLDDDALLQLAAPLGADVSFFLTGAALALAWGRGERLFPLPPLPPAPAVVVAPPFEMPTAEAYAALAAQRSGREDVSSGRITRLDEFGSWAAVAATAVNEFEPVVFAKYLELARVKGALLESGAQLALLAGSGSSVVGIFPDDSSHAKALSVVRERFPEMRAIDTRTGAPRVDSNPIFG